jgi:hypothetical protein
MKATKHGFGAARMKQRRKRLDQAVNQMSSTVTMLEWRVSGMEVHTALLGWCRNKEDKDPPAPGLTIYI